MSHKGSSTPYTKSKLKWIKALNVEKVKVLVTQSGPILCDPMNCSSTGSCVHRNLQASILEWVVIPFSRGSSQTKDRTWSPVLQADSLPFEPPGKLNVRPDTIKLLEEKSRKLLTSIAALFF